MIHPENAEPQIVEQSPLSLAVAAPASLNDLSCDGIKTSPGLLKRAVITSEALSVPPGKKKSEWVSEIAAKHGKSRATIYNYLSAYKKEKVKGLTHTRKTKGQPKAWTPEALDSWIGLVLKRAHRKISKKSLYRILKIEADKNNWKIGSYSNACEKISEILTPQLEALQKGGARALDNSLPPTLRSYADLQPFEIIVGDQHRFDFWVTDPQTGEVFRPEGYLWQDLRTRAIYGLALGKKYNSHMIAHALWIGVRQFGLFRNIYTDNGKPELSRYVTTIVEGVKDFELNAHETISAPTDLSNVHHEETRCDVTLSGQHRKAIVRNAKAKMIEGTFSVLERSGLLDQALISGTVKRLTDPSEWQEVDEKENKQLAEAWQLLTSEEFYQALIAVCDWYNCEKSHRGLLKEAPTPKPKSMTPMDCIEMCMRKEGWRPRMVPDELIDLLFMPKEPNPRTVDRGRIRFQNGLYEHPKLIELNGQKVELRFDPQDLGYVLVFQKDKYLCRAETVEYSSMKDRELASRKIKEKRHHKKMVIQRYKEMTKDIPDVRQFSRVPKIEKTAALIANDKRKKAIENKELYRERTEKELAVEVAELKAISETTPENTAKDPKQFDRPDFFLDEWSRYRWVLVREMENLSVPVSDQEFKKEHEAKMSPDQLKYWERKVFFKEVSL